jgi:hypothetical protein
MPARPTLNRRPNHRKGISKANRLAPRRLEHPVLRYPVLPLRAW